MGGDKGGNGVKKEGLERKEGEIRLEKDMGIDSGGWGWGIGVKACFRVSAVKTGARWGQVR